MDSKTVFSCDSKKYERVLNITSVTAMLFLLAIQLFIMLRFNGKELSDALVYTGHAKNAVAADVWYPSYINLYNTYLFGNGYINLLILSLRLTGGFYFAYVCNIIFTFTILFSCRYILKRICASSQAYMWFTIIFCFFGTFWGETISLRTELSFTAIAFLGFAFLFSNFRLKYAVSGLFFALANWIRPLGIAFIIGAAVYVIVKHVKFKSFAALLAGYIAVIGIIGFSTYLYFGHFVYQSQTMGYNLLVGANDDADGSTEFDVFLVPGKAGYLTDEEMQNMTYADYESFYRGKAIDWILKNPVGYLKLLPKKIFYTFATETYSGSSFFNNETETSGAQYLRELAAKLTGRSEVPIALGDIIMIWTQLLYMAVVVLFIAGSISMFRRGYAHDMLPMYCIFLLVTAITVALVGGARYHFPLLPIMMMSAAAFLQQLFARKINCNETKKEEGITNENRV